MSATSSILNKTTLHNKKLTDYKLVAIDMDGTALNEKYQLNRRTIETIQKVEDNGLVILLATGRMLSAVTEHLNLLGTSGLVVSHNGALVKDVHKNQTYLHNKVLPEVVKTTLLLYEQFKFVLHFNIQDEVFVKHPSTVSKRYAEELGITLNYSSPSYLDIIENSTSILLMERKKVLEHVLMQVQATHPNEFDHVLIQDRKMFGCYNSYLIILLKEKLF
ncbi:HAD family hydrolase [Priestia aryabhattai]|uniref:HAD family hydrolase n=1 Tax=Priestia megaterium TaxID=1404 RepID=UPI0039B94F2E